MSSKLNLRRTSPLIKEVYYACLTALLLFSLFQAINELEINYVETVHRRSYYTTMDATIFSKELDRSIVLMLSLSVAALQSFIGGIKSRRSFSEYVTPCMMIIASLIVFFFDETLLPFLMVVASNLVFMKGRSLVWEYINSAMDFAILLLSLSLVRWLAYPFLKTDLYSDLSWVPSKIEKNMFYFLNATISPLLVTVLMFSWLFSLTLKFKGRIRVLGLGKDGLRISLRGNYEEMELDEPTSIEFNSGLAKYFFNEKVALLLSFLSLLYLAYYSYMPSVNPTGKWTSVDIGLAYVPWLRELESLGLNGQGMNYLLRDAGIRPVVMLMLFSIRGLLGLDFAEVVKLSLFIAGFLLVLSTYCSIKLATENGILSISSIFLTTFSIATVVGLYAGYLGNWVAASFLMFMIGFLTNGIKHNDPKYVLLAVAFSALALYSHPWSWFVCALGVFSLLPLNLLLSHLKLQRRLSRGEVGMLLSFSLANLFLDVSKELLFGSPSGASLGYGLTSGGMAIGAVSPDIMPV